MDTLTEKEIAELQAEFFMTTAEEDIEILIAEIKSAEKDN